MTDQVSLPTLGIIGYGSMGSALAHAMLRSEALCGRYRLQVYAKHAVRPDGDANNIIFASSLRELVEQTDIIILAVRPEQVGEVVAQITASIPDEEPSHKIFVSVAAGVPIASLRTMAHNRCAVFRVMPNTLVEVGKGLFGVCSDHNVHEADNARIFELFVGLGTVIELDESQMNAFTALAGCGPGFLFHIMDSLCEAGVSVGLTREASTNIAVALMEGCACLASATGRHPVILREQGTSPAGMTIAGLNHMDRTGLRGHIIDAVAAAFERGEQMDEEAALRR